jgi:hypothetical protein
MLPHSRKRRLLASSCPSVRQCICISAAPSGRISVKFDIGDFDEICREIPHLVKIGQNVHTKQLTNYNSVYFNFYNFSYQSGRQNILHRMTARIPWVQSVLNFFMSAILICYGRSQTFERYHILKGFIKYLYVMILFCFRLTRYKYIFSFLSI